MSGRKPFCSNIFFRDSSFSVRRGKSYFTRPIKSCSIRLGHERNSLTSSTIKKALQIRFACKTAGYNLLREQQQSKERCRRFRFNKSGSYEHLCCLTLDEMSIKAGYEYDPSTSEIAETVVKQLTALCLCYQD